MDTMEIYPNSLVGRALAVMSDAQSAGRLTDGEAIVLNDLIQHSALPPWTREMSVTVILPDPPALYDE